MSIDDAISGSIQAAWLTFLAYWAIKAFGVKRTAKREGLGGRLVEVAGGAAAFILLYNHNLPWSVLTARFRPPGREWPGAGAVLTWAGVAIAIWARTVLGGNWSGIVTVKENHTLIRTGPYAVVRHPIYSGLLLALLGTGLAVGEVRGLAAAAVVFVVFVIKFRTEERFMTEQFGTEYDDYRRHTRALIPYVF
jgi:protein-S-isoprenylcysteine O-methyltransferase Ste14